MLIKKNNSLFKVIVKEMEQAKISEIIILIAVVVKSNLMQDFVFEDVHLNNFRDSPGKVLIENK